MSRTRSHLRHAAIAASVGVTSLTGAVVTTTPAAAGDITIQTVCNQEMSPVVGGARAYWKAECDDGDIFVTGWVEDTSADGKCGQVEALINGLWERSRKACPKGEVETFTLSGDGYTAYVYLTNK
ncbi:hypothetical protein [Stackebrandtia soli]|uniref:hypothetical protein n=1 Tax=Stackebrandtia soli TaxID=1892856 RepID=UPI0039E80199